jgi:FMN-dependent NADH-azoreductase
MATLLHLDTAIFPDGASASRTVTAAFADAWREAHPDGTVRHRDLAAEPVPHLDAVTVCAGFAAPADHDEAQTAARAARLALIEEVENADAVVIGVPMYNFTIPSTLKTWLDHLVLAGRTFGEGTQSLAGKPVMIVASRGGSYKPGTPPRRLRVRRELPGPRRITAAEHAFGGGDSVLFTICPALHHAENGERTGER